MPYTLNFSDPSNPNTLTVPDMPPGVNAVDTSLTLVGKGYPNYGEKTAENFLHLLENFTGPYPGPNNPIEGQLWYDTTNPNHKVLRVRDGINWSNASGIYQQSDDPRTSAEAPARLRAGDIWVDTSNYQLKIFNNNGWTLVGPMITQGSTTGLAVETLYGSADIPGVAQGHPVIKLWAEGDIVAVITNKAFTPKSVMPGFPELVPGINLRKTASGQNAVPILNGTAVTARNLQVGSVVYNASKFLRIDDNTTREFGGQIVTGKVFFKTPTDSINNEEFGQGEYGIVINNQSSNTDSKYIQFYKGASNAVLLNSHPNGKIVLKVTDVNSTLVRAAEVDYSSFTINTPLTVNNTATLSGNTDISGNLNVGTTATIANELMVDGVTTLNDLTVNGQLIIKNQDEFGASIDGPAIVPYTSGIYDIGSQTNHFNQIFVSYVGTSTTGTVVYGKVKGTATSLEYGNTFKLQGQIESNSFVFNGSPTSSSISQVTRNGLTGLATIKTTSPHNLDTGTAITVDCSSSTFDVLDTLIISTTATSITYYNPGSTVTTISASGTIYAAPATFNSTLTSAAISSQPTTTTTSTTFLALDNTTNTLCKVPHSSIGFPGMISAFGSSNISKIPPGWLLCDGTSYSTTTYANLYAVIGNDYGSTLPGMFKVPNYTASATGGYPIYYIIKT
jgi:hypothetical protein